MIVDKINEYLSLEDYTINDALKYEIEKLAGWAFQRQFMENETKDSKGKIYISQIGKCPRQLAYQFHGFEKDGKEIDGRASLNFFTGDLVELAMASLGKLAFNKLGGGQIICTGLNQLHIELEIDGFKLTGYPDGLLLQNKAFTNIEIKSTPFHRYLEFEKGNFEPDYLAQIQAEIESMGLNKTCFIYYNKNNGVYNERIFDYNKQIEQSNAENVRTVINSTPEKLPDPRHLPNDKKNYHWKCLYCGYWKICHTNAEKVLQGKSYVLKEK